MTMKFESKRLIASVVDSLIVITVFFLLLTVFNFIFPSTQVKFAFMSSMPSEQLHWFFIKAAFLPVTSATYYAFCVSSKIKTPIGLWLAGFETIPRPGVGPLQIGIRKVIVIALKWSLILFVAPLFEVVVRVLNIEFLNTFMPVISIAILGLCALLWLISHLKYSEDNQNYFWDHLSGVQIKRKPN